MFLEKRTHRANETIEILVHAPRPWRMPTVIAAHVETEVLLGTVVYEKRVVATLLPTERPSVRETLHAPEPAAPLSAKGEALVGG